MSSQYDTGFAAGGMFGNSLSGHKPGDVWKNRDGSTSTMDADGSVFTTPSASGMGMAPQPQRTSASQQAVGAAGNIVQGYGLGQLLSRASAADAGAGVEDAAMGYEYSPGMMEGVAPYLPYAGGALAAYMAYKGIKSMRDKVKYQGDLNHDDIAKSVWGDNVIGDTVGKLGDIPVIGPAFGAAFRPFVKGRSKVEENRRKSLAEQGIVVPNTEGALHGKAWENNTAFAQSRNEADLTGADIKDNAYLYGSIPGYSKWSDAQREKAGQQALNMGLVREHHGTIDVNMADSPEYQAWVKQMQAAVDAGAQPQQSSGPRYDPRKEAVKKKILETPAYDPETTQGTRYDYGELLQNRMR